MMKFYEVIANAFANEVTDRNDLPDDLCRLWPFVNVKHQTTKQRVC